MWAPVGPETRIASAAVTTTWVWAQIQRQADEKEALRWKNRMLHVCPECRLLAWGSFRVTNRKQDILCGLFRVHTFSLIYVIWERYSYYSSSSHFQTMAKGIIAWPPRLLPQEVWLYTQHTGIPAATVENGLAFLILLLYVMGLNYIIVYDYHQFA